MTLLQNRAGWFVSLIFVSIFLLIVYSTNNNSSSDFASFVVPVSEIRFGPQHSCSIKLDSALNGSIPKSLGGQKKGGEVIQILLWTTEISPRKKFYIGDERLPGCPARCEFTDDKKLIDHTHAVVVLGIDDRTNNPESIMPVQKKSNQIRVFYLWESPHWFRREVTNFPNSMAINWTMTYRRDSTIPEFYGNFRTLKNFSLCSNEISEMSTHSMAVPSNKIDDYKNRFLEGKSQLIAWTVTRCTSVGKREALIQKLKEFVPIHQYGSCGPLKCQEARYSSDWTSCYRELGVKYKFYLSMENSLCVDYVTEKLFLALQNNMVPIVYGGADYTFFAPPGSYIDATSFGSIKELAGYIQYLDENPEEYLKYFLWRDKFEIYYRDRWCTLCERLWDVSVMDESGQRVIDPNYHHVHENVANWYYNGPQNGSEKGQACHLPINFV